MEVKKRVLITGGTGFIGHYLIDEALALHEYEVTVAVRKESNRKTLDHFKGIHLLELEYKDSGQMRRAFEQLADSQDAPPFHYVIHNAGVTKTLDTKQFAEVNAENTRRLLEALDTKRLRPERFLLMSSMGSYGENNTDAPLCVDFSQCPNTAYGRSKWQAEQYLKSASIPFTILCPTGVYGAGDEDYWLSIMSMKRGWNFLSGRQPQKLSFVYVKDVARAVFFLLNHPEAEGQTFLLSDGKDYTDQDFTRIVSTILNRPVHEVRVPLPIIKLACNIGQTYSRISHKPFTLNRDKYPILSQRNWLCDISPILSLGFQPTYDLEEGLKDAFSEVE